MNEELCQICKLSKFKYTCPKCNILYCSLECYRDQKHLNCSELFYKKCVEEELLTQVLNTKKTDDAHKIFEILQRVSNNDVFNDPQEILKNLDSDDDEEDDDLSNRIKNINFDDADNLWQTLTKEEKHNFETLIQNGEIVKFVPTFEPWWTKQIPKKVVYPVDYSEEEDLKKLKYPNIKENIPDLRKITKKLPHPSVKFNLCNILGAYTVTVRFFAGDHLLYPLEASNYIWMISCVFNKNINFENDEEALKSIIIKGQEENLGLNIEYYEIIYSDVKSILEGPFEKSSSDIFELSALSDIQNLLRKAKQKHLQTNKNENSYIFSKKFANFKLKEELSRDKIILLVKKLDFLLSFVKSKKSIENKFNNLL